jgi:iron complex outermembrane receptor protein
MHHKSLLSLFLATLLAIPINVFAQESAVSIESSQSEIGAQSTAVENPAASAATSKLEINGEGTTSVKVEKVEVTGSHIKRVDVEGASPIQVIDRKAIEKTGYNSVADVLRDTTANSFGSTREKSGSNAAGVAHVNLRGLGSSNTLVLLNGQRLPSDAVTGAVDLNLIPMAAIERVEVLKDGASATYGSDALGGVVNVITRKNFTGNEVSLVQTQPQLPGGNKREISLVNGINTKKLNMVNVVYYRDNDLVNSRDRDWTNKGVSSIGSPGAYRNTGQTWKADSSCPSGQFEVTPQGEICKYKYSDFSTELPELQQVSALSESIIDINDKLKLKARLGATQRTAKWSFAPAPGTFVIPGAVADTLGPGGTPLPGATPGQDLQVRYRLAELGTRDTEVESYSYNALAGAKIQTSDTWELELTTAHNRIESSDEGVNGYALTDKLVSAIQSGQFNPFAPEGQKGNIDNTRYNPLEKTSSELTSLELKATGEIGEISGGAVGLAVGATVTNQKYADVFDARSVAGDVFGSAGSSGGGGRDTQAVFTEFSLPVSEKLEVQLAGRYDRYSDFGDTVNPKAAVLYKLNKKLLLRGSAGTGFKAPLMQDLYAATSEGFPTFIDAVACKNEKALGGATPSCNPLQYLVTSSGNKGLKEEKSVSYNVGVIYEPNRSISFGVDTFVAQLNNKVGIDYDDAMKAELAGVDLAKYGVKVNRDSNGYIQDIVAPMQNLSSQELSGADLATTVRVGKMRIAVEHSRMFYFKEEGFPGAGYEDKLGKNGLPEWRNTATIGYNPTENQDVSFAATTIAGHEKAVAEKGDLPEFTSLDFNYSINIKNLGVLTAGVKNLLGQIPPIDDTNVSTPLDTTLYDQIGRQFYTGLKATF